ncbi:MAG: hypothetical protein JW904_08070 [Spirochaetales bacterium]|nr:hypothetical protein [Spirochaetales bacterium]
MKKLIVLFILLALPLALFAEGFYIGGSALYMGDYNTAMEDDDILNNLAFGADARLQISILEISGLALYNFGNTFNTYVDAGVAIDLIEILTIGAGVGLNFVVNFDDLSAPNAISGGYNGKVHADLNLGDLKVSLYYLILVNDFDLTAFEDNLSLGNVGASVLIKLF